MGRGYWKIGIDFVRLHQHNMLVVQYSSFKMHKLILKMILKKIIIKIAERKNQIAEG